LKHKAESTIPEYDKKAIPLSGKFNLGFQSSAIEEARPDLDLDLPSTSQI